MDIHTVTTLNIRVGDLPCGRSILEKRGHAWTLDGSLVIRRQLRSTLEVCLYDGRQRKPMHQTYENTSSEPKARAAMLILHETLICLERGLVTCTSVVKGNTIPVGILSFSCGRYLCSSPI